MSALLDTRLVFGDPDYIRFKATREQWSALDTFDIVTRQDARAAGLCSMGIEEFCAMEGIGSSTSVGQLMELRRKYRRIDVLLDFLAARKPCYFCGYLEHASWCIERNS